MSVKIRLQRHGRSKSPFYHVVVADSRAPRDGKFIEKIGSYLPQTQPATIELNVDRATYWLQKGAQPTDTCRAILSYKGALLRAHLETGVKKGAFTQEQADEKFASWVSEKINKVEAHVGRVQQTASQKITEKLAEEAKVNAARLQKIAAKAAAAEAAANPVIEETPAPEAEVEAPAVEAVIETPVEVVAETPAEVIAETPVVETVADAPATEETPVVEEEPKNPAE
ncbi:MAG: 30S ribosomal protein S16 [Bacteroidota bacterium]|nr:30S ribosomal protein S16 [Bacteroidota bacterium]